MSKENKTFLTVASIIVIVFAVVLNMKTISEKLFSIQSDSLTYVADSAAADSLNQDSLITFEPETTDVEFESYIDSLNSIFDSLTVDTQKAFISAAAKITYENITPTAWVETSLADTFRITNFSNQKLPHFVFKQNSSLVHKWVIENPFLTDTNLTAFEFYPCTQFLLNPKFSVPAGYPGSRIIRVNDEKGNSISYKQKSARGYVSDSTRYQDNVLSSGWSSSYGPVLELSKNTTVKYFVFTLTQSQQNYRSIWYRISATLFKVYYGPAYVPYTMGLYSSRG